MPAEEWIEYSTLLRPLILFQELPDIALIVESGIYVPPHQRTMLYASHLGSPINIIPCSRGTAKTSTIGTLYSAYMNVHYARRNWVTLSATGFRGGQVIFNDIEKWLDGGWDSQERRPPYIRASIARRPRAVTRAQNYWGIEYDSFSSNTTLPTKDEDSIRGHRAKDLIIDEANTAEKSFIERIAIPFLNVMADMRHGGAYATRNRLFLLSTVDYSWRPFQEQIQAARAGLERDWNAFLAARDGDREKRLRLETEGLLEYQMVMFDYVDVLIRAQVQTRTGKTYKVAYPDKEIPVTRDLRGIPFLHCDSLGRLTKEAPPEQYWMTYAMDKAQLERGLFDGSADEAAWKSEQRNIVDTAVGDVYANELVDRMSCHGDRCIIPYKKLPQSWQETYKESQLDYVPPILYSSQDPCVLGVDYAPLKDFCAFVVIRLGPLAKGEFNPLTHSGNTTWSNVIWCEQYQQMSYREVAEKIRQFRERYNLVYYHEDYEEPEQACRAIGLDMRGGGNGVRDELAWLNGDIPDGAIRLYDPFDKDERVRAFQKDAKTLPMLDTIWPTDNLNEKLVDYTIASMQQGMLYLPKFIERSERPIARRELDIGYEAGRGLVRQLRKLRQEPTKNARRFYMEGDTNRAENKKDLWAAFIYAGKQMRAHMIRFQQLSNLRPPLALKVAKVNANVGGRHGKAIGART